MKLYVNFFHKLEIKKILIAFFIFIIQQNKEMIYCVFDVIYKKL